MKGIPPLKYKFRMLHGEIQKMYAQWFAIVK